MNMNLKNIVAVVAISASTAVMSVWGYGKFMEHQTAGIQEAGKLPVNYAGFFGTNNAPAGSIDFTPAATTATPAVVHIKTKTKAKQVSNSARQRFSNPFSDLFGDDFGDFFGGGPRIIPEQRASGSGVIITDDGYIVTNNHVVDGADDINVTLSNKKSYKATLVGTDPSSDLAVIKIEGKGLPYLVYGNSDDTKLGQWVLAIGYPLTLDVTVTAGIVSAKSRSIGINDRQSNTAIESFIQTDAAVNPGNSGGALINTNGELIGINSAIASPTGSYAGYSYAIPVNMVKKIVTDIVKTTGILEKLGAELVAIDSKTAAANQINGGVLVKKIGDGLLKKTRMQEGFIITSVNDQEIKSVNELDKILSINKGRKVKIEGVYPGFESTYPYPLDLSDVD